VPKLGLLGLNLDERLAGMIPGLQKPEGVVVAANAADAPISRQGTLHAGDVIHALNRASVTNLSDLREAIAALKPGSAAVLQIEREGRLMFLAYAIE
jgi:S1-C subfamily serine protease